MREWVIEWETAGDGPLVAPQPFPAGKDYLYETLWNAALDELYLTTSTTVKRRARHHSSRGLVRFVVCARFKERRQARLWIESCRVSVGESRLSVSHISIDDIE